MRKIQRLVVLGHDKKIGDVFIWLCVLEALQQLSPDTRVAWIGQPAVRKIVEGHPMVDQFLDFPERGLRSRVRLARALRPLRAEAAILLQNNISKRWSRVIAWTGIPIRVGCLDTRKKGRRLTLNIFEPGIEWVEKASARKALDMLGLALDTEVPDTPSRLVLKPETEIEVSRAIQELRLPKHFLVVHLGTGGSNRNVAPLFFARLAARLYEKYGLVPVLSGTLAESDLERQFRLSYSGPCVSLLGKTDVALLAGVCRLAQFILSVDTGTVHAAASVGVPSVVIMPRISVAPTRWAPWCVHHEVVRPAKFCDGCTRLKCLEVTNDACVTTLSEDEAFGACERIYALRAGADAARSPQSASS